MKGVGQLGFGVDFKGPQGRNFAAKREIEENLPDEAIADLAGDGVVDVLDEALKALLGGNRVELLS